MRCGGGSRTPRPAQHSGCTAGDRRLSARTLLPEVGLERTMELALTAALLSLLPTALQQSTALPANLSATRAWARSLDSECGRPHASGRILSGQDATLGEWPWQVSLREEGQHVCGGTLIAEAWVLTAAHCFYQKQPLSAYSVLLGSISSYPQAEEPQELRAVAEFIIHPEYLPETSRADIALVQLASPVAYSDLILPVCLPKPGDPLDHGTWCWVTGWGNIDLSIPLPPPFTLKELSLPLIDAPTCDGYYHENSDIPIQEPIVLEDMLCAGFESGQKDACGGDSGGPLVCDVGGVWVQAGVVSWGFACGLPKRPGVYINVSTYTAWITSTIPGSDLHTENSSPRLAGLLFPPVLLILGLLGDTFAPLRLA
ncbi:serine protease 33-like isoform X1 [Meles meles]|uniref:serine protease 33-like isoform X1 n=1 Tax=Meles meles TaxID=9662 RepID=UPI001E69F992|nr:serine protease 33-like isoform X1 [Meles meles]